MVFRCVFACVRVCVVAEVVRLYVCVCVCGGGYVRCACVGCVHLVCRRIFTPQNQILDLDARTSVRSLLMLPASQ